MVQDFVSLPGVKQCAMKLDEIRGIGPKSQLGMSAAAESGLCWYFHLHLYIHFCLYCILVFLFIKTHLCCLPFSILPGKLWSKVQAVLL